jgi:hypothetical protein
MIGTHMMTERRRRDEVVVRLERPGRTVVALTSMQIANFAGNALELQGRDGRRILALSTTALAALDADQCATIEESATLVPLHTPTIERAGGSVRCTLAGIHLMPRLSNSDSAAPHVSRLKEV